MNSEIKTAWLAALRSGQYQQGRSYLCKDDKYCCLGVLCEVMAVESVTEQPTGVKLYGVNLYERERFLPPTSTLKKAQIYETKELVEMNDGRVPFAQIADWIEVNL